jgi:phosphatidylinositol alpha-1,6-mannosyltransferase
MRKKNGLGPLKILLFTGSFPPPLIGGSVEYVYNIASYIPPGSLVIHTSRVNSSETKEMDAQFPHRIIRSSFVNQVLGRQKKGVLFRKYTTLREYILWPITALFLILKEKPDIVHIGEHNFAGIAAVIAKKIFGIPFIYYTYAEEITILSKRKFHNTIFLYILRHAAVVISVSDYTAGLVINSGIPKNRLRIVLPSVSNRKNIEVGPAEIQAMRQKFGLENAKVLLTVGSVEKRKGHATVVQSIALLKDQYPNIRYIIAGTGHEDDNLRNMVAEMELQNQVIFAGRVSDEDLNILYEICDIFVMPHRQIEENLDTEGCPTVFLEASSHSKVVIGGNAGGVSNAIIDDETGFIIDGTDVQLLSGSIVRLLNDDELARNMGQAGKKYAATLTPEANAARVWEIYKEIAAQTTDTASQKFV